MCAAGYYYEKAERGNGGRRDGTLEDRPEVVSVRNGSAKRAPLADLNESAGLTATADS